MKLSSIIILSSMIGVVIGLQGFVYAAQPGPCLEERQKLCGDVQPGAGRMYKCLQKHEDQLSEACKNHIDDVSQKFQQFSDACSDDLAKYCAQVKPGQGRGIACLRGNEDRLSVACRDALPGKNDAE